MIRAAAKWGEARDLFCAGTLQRNAHGIANHHHGIFTIPHFGQAIIYRDLCITAWKIINPPLTHGRPI